MMYNFTTKEEEAYEMLISLGIDERLVLDCIASRTPSELSIVLEFLNRYGPYIKK